MIFEEMKRKEKIHHNAEPMTMLMQRIDEILK